MENRKCIHQTELIATGIAIALFIILYGVRVLNPFYDGWLYTGGDLTQHYLGYLFYIASDWSFPVIGKFTKLYWPIGISVTYTDSIPIMSFIVKLFRGALPGHFQTFGIFGLIDLCLMGYFSARLLSHFIDDVVYILCGSVFFVLAPVFLYRVFVQLGLSSEWLILWGLCIGLDFMRNRNDGRSLRAPFFESLLMGFFASSIHIYLLVMVTILIFSAMLILFIRSRGAAGHLKILSAWIIYLAVCVVTIYLFGAFETDRDSIRAGGLGDYTFNLNGFFNPQGWSRFLPDLSYYGVPSLTYVGLGVLVLFAAALISFIVISVRRRKIAGNVKTSDDRKVSKGAVIFDASSRAFLILSAVLSFLLSQSQIIAFDGNHYVTLPLPQIIMDAWSVVRDTERFIWVVIYILMFVAMTAVWHYLDRKILADVFLFCLLALQIADISPQLGSKFVQFHREVAHEVYDDSTLDALMENGQYKHVSFTSNRTENLGIMYTLGEYCYHHDLTMNLYYTAHDARIGEAVNAAVGELANPREDTIYIFKPEGDEEMMHEYEGVLHYYQYGQGYIGVTDEITGLEEVSF